MAILLPRASRRDEAAISRFLASVDVAEQGLTH